jgi:hypothetical protein
MALITRKRFVQQTAFAAGALYARPKKLLAWNADLRWTRTESGSDRCSGSTAVRAEDFHVVQT